MPISSSSITPNITSDGSAVAGSPGWVSLGNSPPDDPYLMVKQLRELGYDGGVYMLSPKPVECAPIVSEAGCQGLMGLGIAPEMYDESLSEFAQVIRAKYLEKYGQEISGSYMINPAWIFFQAIERAGTLDTDAVKKELDAGSFDTHLGRASFGGKEMYGVDQQILVPVFLMQVSGMEQKHLAVVGVAD